jgi:enamidase
MQPDVSFHVNGGPIAMPDEDFELVIDKTNAALQVVQAGNIRTALLTLELSISKGCFDRFLIGTDTPTGTGVMPQGMIKTITEMSCLSDHPPEWLIAAATGNNAKVYRLNSGFLAPGKDADIIGVVGDREGLAARSRPQGDQERRRHPMRLLYGAGVPRYIGRSRCTPPPMRYKDHQEQGHERIRRPATALGWLRK